MSVSPNLLKQALKELSEQDRTTTDRWLALDAWKKLLYDKYDFGDGLEFNIIKLKRALLLYGDTPCCKVVDGNRLGIHRRQYQKTTHNKGIGTNKKRENVRKTFYY
jgi:hypothetical protein